MNITRNRNTRRCMQASNREFGKQTQATRTIKLLFLRHKNTPPNRIITLQAMKTD